MLALNRDSMHRQRLETRHAAIVGPEALWEVERYLASRPDHQPTPLYALDALAKELGVAAIHMKDEAPRFGLGSFKSLGGAYAVVRLALEEASRALGRPIGYKEMLSPEVRGIAATLTVASATDGNHGRSVAQGAKLLGARCVIFVHGGVSDERVAAIARFGAEIVRVPGTYDDSVGEAARACTEQGWISVSDTSWPGYERIPGLVMQGYTALIGEALQAMPQPPTHVFVQAGVGGLAAVVAGHLACVYGDRRPFFITVEPSRAACLFETARAGRLVKIEPGEPTVMAMLECYEPSLVAWHILARAGDAFMTVEEDDAVAAMNRLARPMGGDPALVAGESGGVGLAGLVRIAADAESRRSVGLGEHSRILLINTEGATDPQRYRELVGMDPGLH